MSVTLLANRADGPAEPGAMAVWRPAFLALLGLLMRSALMFSAIVLIACFLAFLARGSAWAAPLPAGPAAAEPTAVGLFFRAEREDAALDARRAAFCESLVGEIRGVCGRDQPLTKLRD